MIDSAEIIARMRKLRQFENLSIEELESILAAGNMRPYATDITLFREAEPCAGVFVLVQGQVHLYKIGPDGREHIMATLEPVAMFNEVPVLDGGLNPATAVTGADCIIWHSSRTHFIDLLRCYPQVALACCLFSPRATAGPHNYFLAIIIFQPNERLLMMERSYQ